MELAVAKVAVTLISITKTAHQGGKNLSSTFCGRDKQWFKISSLSRASACG